MVLRGDVVNAKSGSLGVRFLARKNMKLRVPKITLTIYSNLRRMLYLLNYKFLARVCAVLCVLVSVGERRLLTTNPSFWCLRPKEEVTLCGKYI